MFTALKTQIEKDEDELENLILPKYEEIAADLESEIASLDGEYEKLTTAMSKLREEMHREVDNAINQLEREISEIKEKHHSMLQKHMDEIKEIQALIQQSQTDLNELKESNKVCLTIQYTSKNAEYSHFPPKMLVTMPEYQPKQIKREELCRLFGELIPLSTSLEERKTNKTKSGGRPRDIAVDYDGTVLFSDETQKTVYKVKNGQTEKIITLQGWTPAEICVTSSGKPLYSRNSLLKYISENRNLDICVADMEAGAVVVVNQAGKLRFKYTGHPSTTKAKPFKSFGITTDSQSRILTVDRDNYCIHILDTDGQFLRYIDNCDLSCSYGMCVDSNDNLFVCECNEGNVKKIKYCI
uniref:Uncharacterized protein LOC111107603 n=1 Tax=Crassostrea virginica TaxID=6565 RepID=A0A8B8B653_CRAVI|nr:uncharacterized protein LOC111107603 [Crassostrea virginica]